MRGLTIARPRLLVAVLATLLFLVAAPAAPAGKYAPLDRKGPALRVDRSKLQRGLSCSDGVRGAIRAPVLLLPATGVDSEANYSWNYERLLRQQGIPYCTSDQLGPRRYNQTDIQVRAEYIVFAIRKMYRMAARRIAIVGQSQGGMAMRWPLRFWPDTRKKVDDVIGFAGPNHGTASARVPCGDGSCTPAEWQQWNISRFMDALNSRSETFRGIAYTEIFTRNDVVVTPPRRASAVSGPGRITHVAIQEICPNATSDHNAIGTVDPIAAALALDALDHRGPARPRRVPARVCAEPWHAGINPTTLAVDVAKTAAVLARSQGKPSHPSEPRLRCYVFSDRGGCRRSRTGAGGGGGGSGGDVDQNVAKNP